MGSTADATYPVLRCLKTRVIVTRLSDLNLIHSIMRRNPTYIPAILPCFNPGSDQQHAAHELYLFTFSQIEPLIKSKNIKQTRNLAQFYLTHEPQQQLSFITATLSFDQYREDLASMTFNCFGDFEEKKRFVRILETWFRACATCDQAATIGHQYLIHEITRLYLTNLFNPGDACTLQAWQEYLMSCYSEQFFFVDEMGLAMDPLSWEYLQFLKKALPECIPFLKHFAKLAYSPKSATVKNIMIVTEKPEVHNSMPRTGRTGKTTLLTCIEKAGSHCKMFYQSLFKLNLKEELPPTSSKQSLQCAALMPKAYLQLLDDLTVEMLFGSPTLLPRIKQFLGSDGPFKGIRVCANTNLDLVPTRVPGSDSTNMTTLKRAMKRSNRNSDESHIQPLLDRFIIYGIKKITNQELIAINDDVKSFESHQVLFMSVVRRFYENIRQVDSDCQFVPVEDVTVYEDSVAPTKTVRRPLRAPERDVHPLAHTRVVENIHQLFMNQTQRQPENVSQVVDYGFSPLNLPPAYSWNGYPPWPTPDTSHTLMPLPLVSHAEPMHVPQQDGAGAHALGLNSGACNPIWPRASGSSTEELSGWFPQSTETHDAALLNTGSALHGSIPAQMAHAACGSSPPDYYSSLPSGPSQAVVHATSGNVGSEHSLLNSYGIRPPEQLSLVRDVHTGEITIQDDANVVAAPTSTSPAHTLQEQYPVHTERCGLTANESRDATNVLPPFSTFVDRQATSPTGTPLYVHSAEESRFNYYQNVQGIRNSHVARAGSSASSLALSTTPYNEDGRHGDSGVNHSRNVATDHSTAPTPSPPSAFTGTSGGYHDVTVANSLQSMPGHVVRETVTNVLCELAPLTDQCSLRDSLSSVVTSAPACSRSLELLARHEAASPAYEPQDPGAPGPLNSPWRSAHEESDLPFSPQDRDDVNGSGLFFEPNGSLDSSLSLPSMPGGSEGNGANWQRKRRHTFANIPSSEIMTRAKKRALNTEPAERHSM